MSTQGLEISVQDGDLVIHDHLEGLTSYQGKPGGYPVDKAASLANYPCCMVLLEYHRRRQGPFRNLLCLMKDGRTVWKAELPKEGTDAYVDFKWDEAGLQAWSWSGYHVCLDIKDGSIISKVFAK